MARRAEGHRSRLSRAVRLLLPLGLAIPGVFLVGWILVLVKQGPTDSDWLFLRGVAERFVSGDWKAIYAVGEGAIHPLYFWRYPPFALYLVAPLAWFPPLGAYLILAGAAVAALIGSMAILWRLVDLRSIRDEWVLAILCSAPAFTTIVMGQNSALILLCIAAAAGVWTRGRVSWACALLGLLAVKPNWGAFFGLYALVRGEWRGAGAMLAVAVGLCATTLPLGSALWWGFLESASSNTEILANYDTYRLITLRAFLNVTIASPWAASILWGAASIGLLVATVRIWRTPGAAIDHLGATVLLTIAVNPYASFYDALVLVLPATVWWTKRLEWRRGPWLAVGGLIAFAWCWEHIIWTWGAVIAQWIGGSRPTFSFVGPVIAAWLVLWALEVSRADRHAPSGVSSGTVTEAH